MNCLQWIEDAYKLATAVPYGHLIIDLDSKTSQFPRLSSQIIRPNTSTIYVPAEQAVITPFTKGKETFAYAQAMGKKGSQIGTQSLNTN